MTEWHSCKARAVLAGLLRKGWSIKRDRGSPCALALVAVITYSLFTTERGSDPGCLPGLQKGQASPHTTFDPFRN